MYSYPWEFYISSRSGGMTLFEIKIRRHDHAFEIKIRRHGSLFEIKIRRHDPIWDQDEKWIDVVVGLRTNGLIPELIKMVPSANRHNCGLTCWIPLYNYIFFYNFDNLRHLFYAFFNLYLFVCKYKRMQHFDVKCNECNYFGKQSLCA